VLISTCSTNPNSEINSLPVPNISLCNENVQHLHPDAFEATLETTTILAIRSNVMLTNEGPGHTLCDVFNFGNKFKNQEELFLRNNRITLFPENALGPINNLVYFSFGDDSNTEVFQRMESKVFSKLPKLQSLDISGPFLTSEKLAPDTFEGIARDIHVNLRGNRMTQLVAGFE